MGKNRRPLTKSIKKQKDLARTAKVLKKFKSNNTVVTTTSLLGSRSMDYREKVKSMDIQYNMTKHALERLDERALYESDIRNTLTYGASFSQFQAESGKVVYIYEHKCFRVVADREVTADTEEVLVITAMYSDAFNKLVKSFDGIFYATEWRLYRGLRIVYDKIGSAAYEAGNKNRVKHLLIENGYVLHNTFTESILKLRETSTARGLLGENYDDFILTYDVLIQSYQRNWDTISTGDFDYFCYDIGMDSVHLKCNDWNYIVSMENLSEWGLTFEEFRSLIYEVRGGMYVTEGIHTYVRGYRYSVTFCHCGGATFIYDIQENPEYLNMMFVFSKDAGTNQVSRKYFKKVFDTYVEESKMLIYSPGYFEDNYVRVRKLWKNEKKRLVSRGIAL